MKLTHPLSDLQQQQLEDARAALQQAYAAFETSLRGFGQATADRGALETKLAVARKAARISPGLVARCEAVEAEFDRSQQKCAAAQRDLEAARRHALTVIREAGYLIQQTAAPLLDQFKDGLAEALRAFSVDPTRAAAAIPDHGTEYPTLVRFLQRGQHVSPHALPEEIEGLVGDLSETLRRMLAGEDVWQLRNELDAVAALSKVHRQARLVFGGGAVLPRWGT
jgi:hypothetical protein